MRPRPSAGHYGAARSIAGALFVGLTVAAFTVVIFFIAGGGR